MTSRSSLLAVVIALCAGATALCAAMTAHASQPRPLQAIVTSPAARAGYLARAVIWQDPGALSPTDLLNGPSGVFPYTFDEATEASGITCAFEKPGKMLGGKSPKFTCLAPGDHTLRLKYWDQEHETGNRETFAAVAATRLMWALGFMAVPSLPMNIQCEGCPENPASGSGNRQRRRYVAMWQMSLPGEPIVSESNKDQGWSWRELDDAINALPPGEERTRQRTHFGALTLLGVLLQHGDRKPEQQALYCLDPIDPTAGDVRPSGKNDTHETLVERPGASACPRAAVALVDVGATFGGAGRTSNGTTAKMHLESWRRKAIFEGGGDACRGELTISMAAGGGGEGNPVISEEGRQFLVEQLHRLTPGHARAIFSAARVDEIHSPRPNGHGDDSSDTTEAWLAAFQDKVRQLEARHCRPAS
jgi:hypothetical protein